jgi:hypothetical protein
MGPEPIAERRKKYSQHRRARIRERRGRCRERLPRRQSRPFAPSSWRRRCMPVRAAACSTADRHPRLRHPRQPLLRRASSISRRRPTPSRHHASGMQTRRGIVAADPKILPIGTRIRVQDAGRYSGEYTVTDTGPAIKVTRSTSTCPMARKRRTSAAARCASRSSRRSSAATRSAAARQHPFDRRTSSARPARPPAAAA